jgi:hypothetical protein
MIMPGLSWVAWINISVPSSPIVFHLLAVYADRFNAVAVDHPHAVRRKDRAKA